jgi:hypothetical protein
MTFGQLTVAGAERMRLQERPPNMVLLEEKNKMITYFDVFLTVFSGYWKFQFMLPCKWGRSLGLMEPLLCWFEPCRIQTLFRKGSLTRDTGLWYPLNAASFRQVDCWRVG